MASEDHPTTAAPAGDVAPPGRSWSGRRTAVAVFVAVGVAAAGGGAIAAATGGDPSGVGNVAFTTDPGYGQGGYGQSGSGEGDTGQQGRPGRGPGGPGGMGHGVGNALHGEFVVSDGSGGYVTRLVQTGKVTAVDSGSIRVASDDGYSKTYSITSSTTVRGAESASAIAVDTVVTVVADEGGVALSVGDRSARPDGAKGGPGRPGGGTTPEQPDPSSSPTEPGSPQPTT